MRDRIPPKLYDPHAQYILDVLQKRSKVRGVEIYLVEVRAFLSVCAGFESHPQTQTYSFLLIHLRTHSERARMLIFFYFTSY
jgi:hypothetical protein